MLTAICPKLPMRDKAITREYYISQLGFQVFGTGDFDGYLMIHREGVEVHFFEKWSHGIAFLLLLKYFVF